MQPESYLGANGPGPKGTLDSHAKKNYWVEVRGIRLEPVCKFQCPTRVTECMH